MMQWFRALALFPEVQDLFLRINVTWVQPQMIQWPFMASVETHTQETYTETVTYIYIKKYKR